MSCQRVNYVPSKCHRDLGEPHPIKPRGIHARMYIYVSRHPCGRASATPRHEYIYIDRPSRHFSFGSSLCRTRARSVSIPSILYLYRRDVSVFLRAATLHAVFIGNSRMSDESGPTLMILPPVPRPKIPGVFNKTASRLARTREMRIVHANRSESKAVLRVRGRYLPATNINGYLLVFKRPGSKLRCHFRPKNST